jgi:formate dehydrogenase (coenzyme F420) beta subunit
VENIEKKLREEARKLLIEKKVDVLIGYENGTLPLTATPCFITNPDDVEKLVWNRFCTQNLAKFVHDLVMQHKESQKRVKPEDRIKKAFGVVARGCTSRSLVIQIQELQYDRSEVVIVGVPCTGYVDRKKLNVALNQEEILDGSVAGDQLNVRTAKGENKIALKDVLADNCRTCHFNNPVLCDLMLGEPAPAMDVAAEYAEVDEFENMSIEDRWAYFTKEMAKCIRCTACRNVCPSCYCRICFAEQSQPQWVGIGEDPSDTQMFQLMRMYHMVGRCVDCGSCISVCPMGVDLRKFLKKLDKDAFELFEHRAGASLDSPAPLSTFKENDKEDFVYHPGGGSH